MEYSGFVTLYLVSLIRKQNVYDSISIIIKYHNKINYNYVDGDDNNSFYINTYFFVFLC